MNRNISEVTVSRAALAATAITAGAGSDGVKLTGATIDTRPLGNPQTGVFEVLITATLGAGEDVLVEAEIEHTDNAGGSWDVLLAEAEIYSVTDAEAGTVTTVARVPVDLQMAKRYVRLRPTLDLSRSGTDTANIAAVAVFGALDTCPLE